MSLRTELAFATILAYVLDTSLLEVGSCRCVSAVTVWASRGSSTRITAALAVEAATASTEL